MKTIIFDMYGVIIKENRGNFRNFLTTRKPEADEALYQPNYKLASSGQMPYGEFMALFGFRDADNGGQDYVENFLTFDPDFHEFARQEKENGVHLVLLSNDISEWSKMIREYYQIEQYFDDCIISSEVGIRKPEESIFRLALERVGEQPENCIYIDDNPNNLAVAAGLGCQTVLFRRDGGYDGKAVKSFGELRTHIDMLKI